LCWKLEHATSEEIIRRVNSLEALFDVRQLRSFLAHATS
jgi:hypothetical protein